MEGEDRFLPIRRVRTRQTRIIATEVEAALPISAETKALALIAHDRKKDSMVTFCQAHLQKLSTIPLVATGTTGERITSETGLVVQRVLSGPMGGDAQIAALVATGHVRAVIFLVDPLHAHPHEPDIQGLMRVCNVHEVPLATNLATANLLLDQQT